MLTTPFLHIMRTDWPLKANCGNWVLFAATALFLTYSCSVLISSLLQFLSYSWYPIVSCLLPCFCLWISHYTCFLRLESVMVLVFVSFHLRILRWADCTLISLYSALHFLHYTFVSREKSNWADPKKYNFFWRTNTELGKYLENINKQKQSPQRYRQEWWCWNNLWEYC